MPPTSVPIRIVSPRIPRGPIAWLGMAIAFLRLARRAKPTGLFAFHPLSCVLGAIGGLLAGYRFVATQNNPSESQTPLLGKIEKVLGSTGLYTANIAVSGAVRDSFGDYPASYRRKLKVIYNATPPLHPVEGGRDACRAALGLPSGVLIVGGVGRLAEQKYPDFLIPVLAKLPGVHLALAGEGPLRDVLLDLAEKAGVADRLHLLGRVDGAKTTQAYCALDLFLMPSRYEGFGRTLVEAFDVGIPVVANDLPVLREVSGGAASLVELDAELWAAEIQRLLGDASARTRLVQQGRARAADFDLQTMTTSYLAALAS